jgi:threonine/homoserine/homoserine lactone efflux protein
MSEVFMNLYLLFVVMATLTILSPGPGVLKSVSNSLNYGVKRAFIGVLGLSCGVFGVAVLSATSVGAVLASSDLAFMVLKYLGAAYLIYMGIKLWRSPSFEFENAIQKPTSNTALFTECVIFQFSNPKGLVFFLSVFPQFIDPSRAYFGQFALLVMTFCILLVVIHSIYVLCAHRVKHLLLSKSGGRVANRIGGAAFVAFGLMLANTKKV